MAKCVRCGRSGIGLKLDSSGLCPDCQSASRQAQENQIREMKAELEALRKFRDEYIVIPNAKDEADRILSAANRQVEEARQEIERMKAAANLKLAQIQSDSSAAVAAADAQIAALLASAAKDFLHFGKTSVANASAAEAKARAKASASTASASFTLLTPSAFRRAAAKGFVVFDLETTGLSPAKDCIVEIGAIKYDASRTEVNRFSSLVDPERHIPASTTAINNITDDMVKGAPKTSEVLSQFVEFVGGLPIIAHNAEFDVSFLRQAMASCGMECAISYGDSLTMARKTYSLPNYRLATIADHLNVRRGQAHRSLGDCETLGGVVMDLLNR